VVDDEEVDGDEVVKVKDKKGKKSKRSKKSKKSKGKGESENKGMGTKAKGSKNQSPPESDKEGSKEGGKVYIGVRQQSFGLNSTSIGMRQDRLAKKRLSNI